MLLFGRSNQSWVGRKASAKNVNKEYDFKSLGPKLHRLSRTNYQRGSMVHRSHAVAIRFPVDGEAELLDPGKERAWPLSLYRLDQSLKRCVGIYQVSL